MDTPHPSLQRLLDEAPFVRLLARTLLAEDADEVVQQTWLRAIQHGGNDVKAPRAWLGQIVRNVAMNLRRGRSRQLRHEGAARAADLVPSSAELMQWEEQRRMLIAAVDALPEHLRALVLLRYFEGLLPHQIARKLGVPSITVRNQLRRALQLLRERLDAEHGGNRRAWLLPLVPFAASTNGMPWAGPAMPASAWSASTVGIGVLAMTMKTKLMAAIGLLLAMTGALALWATRDSVPASPDAGVAVANGAAVEAANLSREVTAATAQDTSQREAVVHAGAAVANAGRLVVHVRYGDDKSPAADVTMSVRRRGADPRTASQRQRADATGTAIFVELPAGRVVVTSDRFSTKNVDVRAGETTELDFDLDVGLWLSGSVVDAVGTPVAGAAIEVVSLASSEDFETLTASGADGRFSVRGAPSHVLVGARAEGHSASRLAVVLGRDGNQAEVRLQLGPPAGRVEGVVADAAGRPIAGAVVCIGEGRPSGIIPSHEGAPPLPALVRTDDLGCFRAVGVPPGVQPVAAQAADCAPWRGSCDVVASLTASLRIQMSPGGAIRGTVCTTAGEPAAGVFVMVGGWSDFTRFITTTAVDGGFELSGLPISEVVVRADHHRFGKGEHRLHTEAGKTTSCALRLSVGIELRGQVVDETGAPIGEARIYCEARGAEPSWGRATSDSEGRFVVTNCPPGAEIAVTVDAQGYDRVQRSLADPSHGALRFTMRRTMPATARITGVVTTPDGRALPNARVHARSDAPDSGRSEVTGPDGRFELAKLVPGSWTVTIITDTYPIYTTDPFVLGADGVWEMGNVTLAAGGRVIVTVEGDRTDTWCKCVDPIGRSLTHWSEENGLLTSGLLAAGDHVLLVAGKSVAAQAIPFVVRPGEATKVAVKLLPGTQQRFDLVPLLAEPLPQVVALRIHRGVRLMHSSGVALQAGRVGTGAACLLPGDYTIAVFDRDRQLASASFSIGTTEAPPLRLELR